MRTITKTIAVRHQGLKLRPGVPADVARLEEYVRAGAISLARLERAGAIAGDWSDITPRPTRRASPAASAQPEGYAALTKAELLSLAVERGLDVTPAMKRGELVAALESAETAPHASE